MSCYNTVAIALIAIFWTCVVLAVLAYVCLLSCGPRRQRHRGTLRPLDLKRARASLIGMRDCLPK